MPLYEYKCPGCDRVFEELVSSSDEAPACPTCGSTNCGRLMSVFSSNVRRGSFASCTKDSCSGCSSSFT